MGTSNSAANHTVFHAQVNMRSLEPIETCNSDPKDSVLTSKSTDQG